MTIVTHGEVQSETHAVELANSVNEVAVAKDAEFLTHFWSLRDDDGHALIYFGTPETFEQWQRERVN